MADFAVKPGRPVKGAKKRDQRLNLRVSVQELDLLDQLAVILNKRRNIGESRSDLLAYLVEREFEKQQNIAPF